MANQSSSLGKAGALGGRRQMEMGSQGDWGKPKGDQWGISGGSAEDQKRGLLFGSHGAEPKGWSD